MARILVVDDYPDFAKLVVNLLKVDRHDCRWAGDAAEAVRIGLEFKPDVLLVDWRLRDSADGGLAVARKLWEADPAIRILIMTGSPETIIRQAIGDLPVTKIMEKPFNALTEIRSLLPPA